MAKFLFGETIHQEKIITTRLGTVAEPLTSNDIGKPVKLIGDSAYGLCAAGDNIEGIVSSINNATQDGFVIGGVSRTGYAFAQAGVVLAIKDQVVAGANAARGVKQAGYMRVNKAGASPTGKSRRVESLGDAGTGAVGTQVCLDMD